MRLETCATQPTYADIPSALYRCSLEVCFALRPMPTRPILTPGPDHPITIEPNSNRVQIRAGDIVIANTSAALTLREAGYPAVHYIPRGDVDMAQLRRSGHASYCPYKGDAAYFHIAALGEKGANAIWTYEQPYEAVGEIAEYLAFYPHLVEITEVVETAP
jgi:uncharacterized protein (DUF427 family)